MPALNWIGREAVERHHTTVPFHLLQADPKRSVGDPSSGNLLVEGDNLLALKALLPYYAGQVKCIYIDPPYNTGSSQAQGWTYNDNVDSPQIHQWLGKVVGKEAEDLSRHDKWLCMMYPRLILLRMLLRDDGIIFISIGKDEIGYLRVLADEVFLAANLLEVMIWNTEGHTENQEEITSVHEYVLVYAKNKDTCKLRRVVDPSVPEDSKIRRSFAENSITKNTPKNPPSAIALPIGFPCEAESLDLPPFNRYADFEKEAKSINQIPRSLTKKYNAVYPVRKDKMTIANYQLAAPCTVFSGWSSANKLKAFIENDCKPIDDEGTKLSFYLSKNGVVYYRREGRESHYVSSVIRNAGTTEKNRYELEAMGIEFTYPKPKELICYLLSLATQGDDIILDSFLGSGTTGHATLLLNQLDNQNRRFIGIELETQNAANAHQRLKTAISGYPPSSRKFNDKTVQALGGGFQYCTLGPTLFDAEGHIRTEVSFDELARFVYFKATGTALPKRATGKTPFLGVHNDTAIYLLYNGILKDKSAASGNVLTRQVLASLLPHSGPKIIYGTRCLLGNERLRREAITFKHLPTDLSVE